MNQESLKNVLLHAKNGINPLRRCDYGQHADAGAYLTNKRNHKRYLRANRLGKHA